MEIITARPHRLTKELVRLVGEQAAAGGRCIVLVPSQETLHTELTLMEGLGADGFFTVDVLSPGRLRDLVFERGGRPAGRIYDERGKRMVLSAVLEEEQANLRVYGRAAEHGQQSLAAKLSETLAGLKRSGVDPERLQAMAAAGNEALNGKLEDIARVYARYKERMAGSLDAEDLLEEALRRMEPSGVLRGRHVFVSGFDILTPAFARELAGLAKAAASLTVLMETDANGAMDGALFAPVNFSLDRLCAEAAALGLEMKKTALKLPLDAPDDLQALEAGLCAAEPEVFHELPQHIQLRAASGIRREAHLACAEIRRLAAEGEPLEEVGVLYPAEGPYASLMASILPQYGIAAYTAEKRPAAAHPLSRFLLSALGARENGRWRMAEVAECLQSGFLPLAREEGDALCAYCEQMEIRGDGFGRPFRWRTGEQMTEEALAAVEESRRRAAEPLMRLHERLGKSKTADEAIGAVLALLDEVDAQRTLETLQRELEAIGFGSEAQDCAQIWNALMETLDQLHTALEGCASPGRLTRRLLESGLTALELSALPPAGGAVLCGSIGNLRIGRVRRLFVLGMNDRATAPAAGMFTARERETLEQDGVHLGLGDRERDALDRLHMLQAMTSARETLYVSYSLSDESGAALREGEAVQALRRIFPALRVTGGLLSEELPELLCAPGPAALSLALALRDLPEEDGRYAPLCAALQATEEGKGALAVVRERAMNPPPRRVTRGQAERLYGLRHESASVSRLETFAGCPYRYFVQYGLRPAPERQAGVDAADLGTLYHEAVRRFVDEAMALPSFPKLSDTEIAALTGRVSEEVTEPLERSPLGETKRGEALRRRAGRTIERVSRRILQQITEGGFTPYALELAFGEQGLPPLTIALADGTHLHLRGRIDRVDVLTADGRSLRVIDYKSGQRRVDATRVYYGLQLQLLIYLAAALRAVPEARAAGFFYFQIADPNIKTDKRVAEEVEKELAKRFSLSGVTLSDVEIIRAQDRTHADRIKKDGTPGRGITAVDDEGMGRLLAFAQRKAAELYDASQSGVIDDDPYELPGTRENDVCTMCGLGAVCGFDPSRRQHRALKKKTMDDLTCGPV